MTPRIVALVVAFVVASAVAAGCAAPRTARSWQPGEAIICPHCAREFRIPEKLGR